METPSFWLCSSTRLFNSEDIRTLADASVRPDNELFDFMIPLVSLFYRKTHIEEKNNWFSLVINWLFPLLSILKDKAPHRGGALSLLISQRPCFFVRDLSLGRIRSRQALPCESTYHPLHHFHLSDQPRCSTQLSGHQSTEGRTACSMSSVRR